MFALILLTLATAWLVRDFLHERYAVRQEAQRLARRAELRQRLVDHAPGSPASHEALGDALRASGDLEEALAAYEESLALTRYLPEGVPSGTGWLAGSGLENKMRLTKSQIAQERSPERFGLTVETRQQFCRTCASLGMPGDRDCRVCGAPLPVEGLRDAWRHLGIRQSIIGEVTGAAVLLLMVFVALLIASWMPLEVRGALAIAVLIVVPLRLLKKIGDG